MSEYEDWKKRHKFADDDKILNRYWESIRSNGYAPDAYFEMSEKFTGFWEKSGGTVLTLRLYESELFSELYDTIKLQLDKEY